MASALNDDGSVINHANQERGRWSFDKKVLTVRFADTAKPKRWTIKSIDDKEMVLHRTLENNRTSIEHLIRLDDE